MFKLIMLISLITLLLFVGYSVANEVGRMIDCNMYKTWIKCNKNVMNGYWSRSKYGLVRYEFEYSGIKVLDKSNGSAIEYYVCNYQFARKVVSGQIGVRQWVD